MASSEGLASVEPWSFRQSFSLDSWLLSETFSRDDDLFTRALQKSISSSSQQALAPPREPLSPSAFLDSAAISDPSPSQSVPTLSNLSGGSDPDSAGTKRKRISLPVAGNGKATKRRNRVSKKSQTTFITADAANFRQMVQEVTGAKYIDSYPHGIFAAAPIVKPEPHRLGNRLPCGPSDRLALPTLDTSAFLSNHHQESLVAGNNNTFSGNGQAAVRSGQITSFQSGVTADVGGSDVEFDSYPSFPTLESWKVM